MNVFDDHERQQQLQALIQHVFSPSSPGDAAEKRLDPLAQARSTATPVELTIFLQSSALREATEKYLRDISALWLLAKPVPPRIQFQLPNARVGQPYAARLEGKDLAGNPVSICDAWLPVAVGLSFDPASGEMRGTPLVDGDYKIALRWSSDGVAEYAGECLLFVNSDPRSLWKQLEPPADAPYFKPHTDAALIAGPGFSIAAASRRGRSHEHVGSFRDDDFFVQHDDASGWSLLIVADG
ncbi:MAG: protein phosphatase 2C domain-containing protein, partial [Polaromonas sp.]|nr:protein phosphatase 2C domain-containing protein [Polaromonas sp.]